MPKSTIFTAISFGMIGEAQSGLEFLEVVAFICLLPLKAGSSIQGRCGSKKGPGQF